MYICMTDYIKFNAMRLLRLRIGAMAHFAVALGHVACLFFLKDAFNAYGILDEMTQLCFGYEWLLYAVTIFLSIAFAIAGLYALSASGDIRRLPIQKLVITAIIAVYSIRTVVGIFMLIGNFNLLELFSTAVPALLVWCYLPGLKISAKQ